MTDYTTIETIVPIIIGSIGIILAYLQFKKKEGSDNSIIINSESNRDTIIYNMYINNYTYNSGVPNFNNNPFNALNYNYNTTNPMILQNMSKQSSEWLDDLEDE